jgi:hypothetical protein
MSLQSTRKQILLATSATDQKLILAGKGASERAGSPGFCPPAASWLVGDDLEAEALLRELDEAVDLVVVDIAVPVRIGVVDALPASPPREPRPDGAHRLPQLVAADTPVAVHVEPPQPLLELIHGHVPVQRSRRRCHRHVPDRHLSPPPTRLCKANNVAV